VEKLQSEPFALFDPMVLAFRQSSLTGRLNHGPNGLHVGGCRREIEDVGQERHFQGVDLRGEAHSSLQLLDDLSVRV
jgi:hypothetical protein